MKKLIVFAVLAVVSACGPVTPEDACVASAKAQCKKMHTCPGVKSKLGETETGCVDFISALCKSIKNDTKCEDGKAYPSADVASCANELNAQSCEDYIAEKSTASCDKAEACTLKL